jgi:hypothetical protein
MLFNHKLFLITYIGALSQVPQLQAASNSSMILGQSFNADATSRTTQKSKKELNKEFMQHAKITDLVSYIYYPYSGDAGRAELEVEGRCWTMKFDKYTAKSLDRKLLNRKIYKNGHPFYRYVISVTPAQLKKLSETIGQGGLATPICSLNVLTELSRHANYSVPFACRLSPLVSSYALSFAKLMGSSRIKSVNFHENERLHRFMSKGVVGELVIIGMILGAASFCTLILAAEIIGSYRDL